jgi:hypothetical protein
MAVSEGSCVEMLLSFKHALNRNDWSRRRTDLFQISCSIFSGELLERDTNWTLIVIYLKKKVGMTKVKVEEKLPPT